MATWLLPPTQRRFSRVCSGQVFSTLFTPRCLAVGTGLSTPWHLYRYHKPGRSLPGNVGGGHSEGEKPILLVDGRVHMLLTAPAGPNPDHPAAVQMQLDLFRALSLKEVIGRLNAEFWRPGNRSTGGGTERGCSCLPAVSLHVAQPTAQGSLLSEIIC
jgi:hypothetical protein